MPLRVSARACREILAAGTLGEGATEAEVLEAYPRLTPELLRAAVLFAADMVKGEEIVFFTPDQAATR